MDQNISIIESKITISMTATLKYIYMYGMIESSRHALTDNRVVYSILPLTASARSM